MKILLSCLVFIGLVISNTSVINAQEEKGFIQMNASGKHVVGGYYHVKTKPGKTIALQLELINSADDEKASTTLFTSDAYTATNGSMATIAPEKAKREFVGKWLDFKEQRFELAPAERKTIPLTIQLPSDIKPGEYVGMISTYKIVRPDEAENNEENTQISINKAYTQAIAVLVEIEGEKATNLEINELTQIWNGANLGLDFTLNNSGDRMEAPDATVRISQDNEILHEQSMKMKTFYPKTTSNLIFMLPEELRKEGEYDVELTLKAREKEYRKSFELLIGKREVEQAKEIEKSQNDEEIMFTKAQLIKIVTLTILAVFLFIGIVILIRKKFNKKNR